MASMVRRGAMKLLWLISLIIALAIVPGLLARAQDAGAGSPAAPPAITGAEARQALEVLNNPQKRAEMVSTLETIIKAQSPQSPAMAATGVTAAASAPATASGSKPAAGDANVATPAKVQLKPNSLGAVLVTSASGWLGRISAQAVNGARKVQSIPLLWGWAVVMATNPVALTLLREAAWRVAIAFACGLLIEWAVRRLLRRPVLLLEGRLVGAAPVPGADIDDGEARAEAGEGEPRLRRRQAATALLKRLPLALTRLMLDLLPVLAFAFAGHIVAVTPLGGTDQTRLIVLAMVDAYATCSAVICFARMMLSAKSRQLRLLPVSDPTAMWATRWVRRIAAVAIFGYAIASVGLLLNMSLPAHDGLLKTAGLINHIFLAVMVVQKRRAVAKRLHAPPGVTGVIARMRNAIAPVWHWIALFFIAAIWIVWAVEIPNGFTAALRFFVVLVLVLAVARMVSILLLGSIERAMHLSPEIAERYPGLDSRLQAYHPLLQAVARGLVAIAAGIALLEFWGVPLFAWFTVSLLGRRLAAAFGTTLLTVVLALMVWEAANAAIEANLARLTRAQQAARAARLRTLLPLLRATLLVVIVVIAGLTVLSEIGINIAPLLAGAGIVGVAIGFGSQKLVQDLITGIFLLLENAVQVGDWVTVSGLSGSVEHLSVRTIRLRAGDGSVHIIPFSAVTSVTNINRGLGNAAVSVTVAYAEDTDRVSEVLKEIAAEMRTGPDFASKMLSDLQLWGVDKVDGASVTISGQIPCTNSGRWAVQREFNRRMKMRFQELGIAFWNPAQTYIVPRAPNSPRATLQERREAAAE